MIDPPKIVRIETGARLHFGLIDTVPPFGGLGVMIDRPSTVVEITASNQFTVDPSHRDRAQPIAERFCAISNRASLPNVAIRILETAPPHSGFGSGTQLSLAIAECLCRFCDRKVSDETLAVQIADRGKRSAVGVHGYFGGGLIFEASVSEASVSEASAPEASADNATSGLNPIQRRVELPDQWRLVLMRPAVGASTVSGDQESEKFEYLTSSAGEVHSLRTMIIDKILPSADAGDFHSFTDAVESYNHASGMLFAKAQGGPYNGGAVTELINTLKNQGACGVGQSSWGPGVFAWCEDEAVAQSLAQRFENPAVQVAIAKVKQDGRRVDVQA